MKLLIETVIKDYEGADLIEPEKEKPLTYREVIINSLNAQIGNEQIPAELKNRIYQVTKKIYAGKEPDFTPAQLQLIKERVGKAYSPLVYGRLLDFIDGENRPEETTKDLSKAN